MSKSSLKRLTEDADDVLDDVVSNLKEMATQLSETAGDKLSQTAVSLAHSVVELAETAKTKSAAMAKTAGKEVRAHPVSTAAIAAAAVALVGLVVARSKTDAE